MSHPRLLIADDDWFVSALLERILSAAGYEVVVVASGSEALQRLRVDKPFDTVLLDRQMPGLDGMAVLKEMKAAPDLRDIPVVLQTAMDGEEEVLAGLKAGAHYYLVKPMDPKFVLQVVGAATAEYANRRRFLAEMAGIQSALGLIRRGMFRYQTLQQCHDLAALLAKACPDPRRSVIGLSELMINALEHGNLGISYEEKTELIEARSWAAEVERRQALPQHRDQWVTVTLQRTPSRTRFRIQDMGRGFAWKDFQDIRPERMFDTHGRGILLAKWEAFDHIAYQGNGNCVVAEVQHGGASAQDSGSG